MIIKIYDRYTYELYHIIEVKGLTKDKLIELKKGFKEYLNKALKDKIPLDSDDNELFEFIESKGYEIEPIVIDEEIDL